MRKLMMVMTIFLASTMEVYAANGDLIVDGALYTTKFKLSDDSGDHRPGIVLKNTNSTGFGSNSTRLLMLGSVVPSEGTMVPIWDIYSDSTRSGSNDLSFVNYNKFGTAKYVLYLDGDSGNIGIGTTATEKLAVNGAVKLTSNPVVINNNDASYFWNQAGVGPTVAGYQFEIQTNGNTPRFKIDYLGKVGIGTTNPAYTLDVNGTISGSNVSPSDIRLKENISPVELAIEKVSKLHGVSFDWKQGEYGKSFPEGRHYGVIAQEIETVLPEVVSTAPDGTKAVAYTEIIPVLIEAIKEQQKTIEKQQAVNSEQQKRIEKLEKILDVSYVRK